MAINTESIYFIPLRPLHSCMGLVNYTTTDDEAHLISPQAIEPIQSLKVDYLGSKNPRLHTDEVLIALAISAKSDERAKKAMSMLPQLKGCQVHTSVMLTDVDTKIFQKLGVDLTSEASFG